MFHTANTSAATTDHVVRSHRLSLKMNNFLSLLQLINHCQCEQTFMPSSNVCIGLSECPCLVVTYVYIFPCDTLEEVCILCVWVCLFTVAHTVSRLSDFKASFLNDQSSGLLWPVAKVACTTVLLLYHNQRSEHLQNCEHIMIINCQ